MRTYRAFFILTDNFRLIGFLVKRQHSVSSCKRSRVLVLSFPSYSSLTVYISLHFLLTVSIMTMVYNITISVNQAKIIHYFGFV